MKLVETAAARGAQRLDEAFGTQQWATGVDLSRLDMSSCAHCVLAQVYGSYVQGLEALHLMSGSLASLDVLKLGFATFQPDQREFSRSALYAKLDAAWMVEIRTRQSFTETVRVS